MTKNRKRKCAIRSYAAANHLPYTEAYRKCLPFYPRVNSEQFAVEGSIALGSLSSGTLGWNPDTAPHLFAAIDDPTARQRFSNSLISDLKSRNAFVGYFEIRSDKPPLFCAMANRAIADRFAEEESTDSELVQSEEFEYTSFDGRSLFIVAHFTDEALFSNEQIELIRSHIASVLGAGSAFEVHLALIGPTGALALASDDAVKIASTGTSANFEMGLGENDPGVFRLAQSEMHEASSRRIDSMV